MNNFPGTNLFDAQMVFLKGFFEKVDFEKISRWHKSMKNFPESNMFDTQLVFLKGFFEKVDLEKNQQTT